MYRSRGPAGTSGAKCEPRGPTDCCREGPVSGCEAKSINGDERWTSACAPARHPAGTGPPSARRAIVSGGAEERREDRLHAEVAAFAVPATVVAVLGVVLVGLGWARVRGVGLAAAAAWLFGWAAFTSWLARSGQLGAPGTWPVALGAAGGLAALLVVATPTARRAVDRLPLAALVAFQAFRLPTALVVGWGPSGVPMAGLTEVAVGGSAVALTGLVAVGRAGRAAVAAWNLAASVALGFVAWSLLPSGQPTWFTGWPGAWVPLVLGELALCGHLVVARRVATESMVLGPWLSLASMIEAALGTTWSRWVRGPARPSWSWQYEATVTWLRDRFTSLGLSSPRLVRRHVDVVGGWGAPTADVDWAWTEVAGRTARWAIPRGGSDSVALFLHGGGYVFGSIRSHPGLIGTLAEVTGRRVLAIDYRLAPEHPCPAALDDALAAWDHLVAQGWDPTRIVVIGDSAGGGLALALLLTLRDRGGPLPAGAVLVSPWTDLALTGDSLSRWADTDYLGTLEVLERYAGYYLGGLDARDWRASPLYGDPRGLPPLLFLVGACEMLLDDTQRFAARARDAGVPVTVDVEEDEVHVYPVLGGFTPRAGPALERVGAWVRALSASSARG